MTAIVHVTLRSARPEDEEFLLKQLMAEAGRAGKPLRLTVLKHNARAIMLYQKLGFSVLYDDGICISMTSGEPSVNLPVL